MKRGTVVFGVLAVTLGTTLGSAEAKLVRYEINGQRYSYSTNNRQQVQEARQRIQAAQTAAAAKAQADAERAANPLAGVFGSPTQAGAAEAQARAQQALAQPAQNAADATNSIRSRRAGRRQAQAEARAERARERREAETEARRSRLSQKAKSPGPKTASKADTPAERRQGLQEAQAERNRTPDVQTERLVANEPKRAGEAVPPTPRAATPGSSPASESVSPANGQKPAIKSVSFDLSSGIKTIRMMDGTVHEEPIDSSAMSKLGSEPAGASLTSFVDQVRKAPRPQ